MYLKNLHLFKNGTTPPIWALIKLKIYSSNAVSKETWNL